MRSLAESSNFPCGVTRNLNPGFLLIPGGRGFLRPLAQDRDSKRTEARKPRVTDSETVPIKIMLTQDQLKRALTYNPEIGFFTWNKTGKRAGSDKGTKNQIQIAGKMHMAHKLAWLYSYGETPSQFIDHRDRNPLNNRLSNLRLSDDVLNAVNSKIRSDNKIGVKGVAKTYGGKFKARIWRNGKAIYLGTFDTVLEADSAFKTASKVLYGDFAVT